MNRSALCAIGHFFEGHVYDLGWFQPWSSISLSRLQNTVSHTRTKNIPSNPLEAHKVSLYDMARAGVRPCAGVSTLSNMNIFETGWSSAVKFYPKHHLGGGKPALGFGPDQIRTLVFMATDSSHRVIIGKTVLPLFLGCF